MVRFERFFYIICILLLLVFYAKIGNSHANVLKEFQDGFVSVVHKVTPSVVNISAEGSVNRSPFEDQFRGTPFEQFFHQFFAPQFNQHFTSLGSGVIVRKDGYILTNNHVIRDASNISVILSTGKTLRHAKIVGVDPTTDLAVIKVNSEQPLPAGTFGDSDSIQVGSWAVAIGNPYGFNSTVTVGVISAKGRNLSVEDNPQASYHNLIQTDASINPGNSGGALVDIDGNIIGIDTSIATPSGGSVGIGFAIPINTAKSELSELITKGKVEHGWLGVSLQPLTPALSKAFGVQSGVLIADVLPKSPAEKAGLKHGDVLLKFNGKMVKTPEDFRDWTVNISPGALINVEILRNKEHLTVPVLVGTRPAPSEASPSNAPAYWGLHLEAITPQLVETFNLTAKSGLLVASVDANSLGAQAGIVQGDIVLEVNRVQVTSLDQFVGLLKQQPQGEPTLFLVQHQGVNRYVALYQGNK